MKTGALSSPLPPPIATLPLNTGAAGVGDAVADPVAVSVREAEGDGSSEAAAEGGRRGVDDATGERTRDGDAAAEADAAEMEAVGLGVPVGDAELEGTAELVAVTLEDAVGSADGAPGLMEGTSLGDTKCEVSLPVGVALEVPLPDADADEEADAETGVTRGAIDASGDDSGVARPSGLVDKDAEAEGNRVVPALAGVIEVDADGMIIGEESVDRVAEGDIELRKNDALGDAAALGMILGVLLVRAGLAALDGLPASCRSENGPADTAAPSARIFTHEAARNRRRSQLAAR